jgi:3-hydroxyacyl-[acyl-carrier-protein] dehydratase
LTPEQVLELVPQRPPFRFIDELVELDNNHAIGRYTFKLDESFYAGHFPGNPVTPGVILLETMCQTGIVALGLYLLAQDIGIEELKSHTTLFTDADVEFSGMVSPGETVTVTAEPVFWRRHKLRSKVQMSSTQGKIVASGFVSGMGVKLD